MLPHSASGAAGCVVLMEGDPPPTSPFGRISFKGFNPATDKLRVRPASYASRYGCGALLYTPCRSKSRNILIYYIQA